MSLADVRLRSLRGVVTEVSRLESLVALLEVISLAAAASAGPFHRTRIPRAVAAHVRRFALRPAWCTVACPSNGPLEEATMVASLYLASDVPGGALATLTPFAKRAFRPRGSGAGPLERATAIFPPVLSTAPNSRHGRNITVRLLPLRRGTASGRTDGSLAAHSRPNALRLALGRLRCSDGPVPYTRERTRRHRRLQLAELCILDCAQRRPWPAEQHGCNCGDGRGPAPRNCRQEMVHLRRMLSERNLSCAGLSALGQQAQANAMEASRNVTFVL